VGDAYVCQTTDEPLQGEAPCVQSCQTQTKLLLQRALADQSLARNAGESERQSLTLRGPESIPMEVPGDTSLIGRWCGDPATLRTALPRGDRAQEE
jgi:hypothetical protein